MADAAATLDFELITAAREGDLQALAARLAAVAAAGSHPDAETETGSTALVVAAREGNVDAVRMLLAHGADPNRPLRFGKHAGLPVLLRTFSSSEADLIEIDVVCALLSHGADPDPNAAWPRDRQSALMWAAKAGMTKVVRTLLIHGADLNAQKLDADGDAVYFEVESRARGAGPIGRAVFLFLAPAQLRFFREQVRCMAAQASAPAVRRRWPDLQRPPSQSRHPPGCRVRGSCCGDR